MQKALLGGLIALATLGAAHAQGNHAVSGYYRSNGTYVAPHMQTNPDSTRANNWSTQGNVNPYTGQEGTKPLYTTPTYQAPSYAPAYQAPRLGGGILGGQPNQSGGILPGTPRPSCYGYGC